MVEVGDIIFTKTASVGKTALIKYLPQKATINPQLVVLKKIQCLPAYLSYALQSHDFQFSVLQKVGQGSVPNISQSTLSSFFIPLPPLSEQERIVSILDRFETLTQSITEGLPHEIALRRKQYEYYRERLLTFPTNDSAKIAG